MYEKYPKQAQTSHRIILTKKYIIIRYINMDYRTVSFRTNKFAVLSYKCPGSTARRDGRYVSFLFHFSVKHIYIFSIDFRYTPITKYDSVHSTMDIDSPVPVSQFQSYNSSCTPDLIALARLICVRAYVFLSK